MSKARGVRESAADDQSPDLSHDERFDLLSNPRRRYALRYLDRNGESATVGELSDQIAAWENGIEPAEISYDQRKRVYTSLQQVHLPRLDEADVVVYDDREGVIKQGPAAEELAIYLEVVEKDDISWVQLYVALSVVAAMLVIAGNAGLTPVGAVPGVVWAVLVLAAFSLTSVAHTYDMARKELE